MRHIWKKDQFFESKKFFQKKKVQSFESYFSDTTKVEVFQSFSVQVQFFESSFFFFWQKFNSVSHQKESNSLNQTWKKNSSLCVKFNSSSHIVKKVQFFESCLKKKIQFCESYLQKCISLSRFFVQILWVILNSLSRIFWQKSNSKTHTSKKNIQYFDSRFQKKKVQYCESYENSILWVFLFKKNNQFFES